MDETAFAVRSLGQVEEIGLFPLGLVLNPGATFKLPLHIFEMQYSQLFNNAWDGSQKVACIRTLIRYAAHCLQLQKVVFLIA